MGQVAGRNRRWIWLVVALVAGVALSRDTWSRAFVARQSRTVAEADLAEAEAERLESARRTAATTHPLGDEEAARARGYRREGESPVEAGR